MHVNRKLLYPVDLVRGQVHATSMRISSTADCNSLYVLLSMINIFGYKSIQCVCYVLGDAITWYFDVNMLGKQLSFFAI